MRVGPHVSIEKLGKAYQITFHLTDGKYQRNAGNRSEMVTLIERVLPGYLTPALRRMVGDAKR